MADHICPGCGGRRPNPNRFSCRDCWSRLPAGIRARIITSWRVNATPDEKQRAADAALAWYRDNPREVSGA